MMGRRLTTEEFIERARAAHGDRYDYSRVDYVNSKTKVEIICPEHDSFWQSPHDHSMGHRCFNCGVEIRSRKNTLTIVDFVKQARNVHKYQYDYSKVDYVNSKIKIEIICPKHGGFWQTPNAHTQGQGCPDCGIELVAQKQTLTVSDFIERAREIHGDKYDYSRVDYKKSKFEVEIICPEHGIFWQVANVHLQGCGCPDCGIKLYAQKATLTTIDFIKRAKKIHGDKYNYSRAIYRKSKLKIEIICPKHGSFWQAPNEHIHQKQGCPLCGIEARTQKATLTMADFIERAREVHGNKYDYLRVDYKKFNEKVEIICPKHGTFWQAPNNHIAQKQGCPDCGYELVAQKQTLTKSEFLEQARRVHGDRYDYSKSDYKIGTIKVEIICPKHGSFWQTPSNHIHQESNCPSCQSSKGEQRIAKFLASWRIPFTRQKRFDACKNKDGNYLPFDFYFQLGKYFFLIEYDGQHHFEPIEIWGSEEKYLSFQHHDAIKNRFAADHADYGFVLIRISYTQYDNIETILKTAIKKHTGQSLTTVSEKLLLPPQTRPTIDPGQWTQLNLF